MELKIRQEPHATYHYLETRQFKTVEITLRFFDTLEPKRTTTRHLMLMMLRAKNRFAPSRKSLNRLLEHLYDTRLAAQSAKLGTAHVNQLTLSFVNPSIVGGADFFYRVLQLLKETLFHPVFDEKTLEEEKQFLKDYFKAEYAEKTRYAQKRFFEHLFEGHPYRLSPFGEPGWIDAVTLTDIKEAHARMIEENPVLITSVGDLEAERTHTMVKYDLAFAGNAELPDSFTIRTPFEPRGPRRESLKLEQDRLFMAFDSDVYHDDPDYFSMVVLSELFGGGSESLLFRRVREEASLCYHIGASFLPFSGLLTVHSAMKAQNVDLARETVLQTFHSLQQGDFTDRDLTLAKNSLITTIKQSYDHPRGLAALAARSQLFDAPFKEEERLQRIHKVEREDIQRAATRLSFIFTYVLGSEDA